jgi:hypothetical protein
MRELVDGGLLVTQLDLLRADLGHQLLRKRAHLGVGQLVDGCVLDHRAHGASATPTARSSLSAIAQPRALQQADHTPLLDPVREHLPRQPEHERVELCAADRLGAAGQSTRPDEATLMQPTHRGPQTEAVVHKDLEPVGAPIGEQVRVVRLGSTKHADHTRQGTVRTEPQIDWLDGELHGVDADHASQLRSRAAHWPAAATGQRICSAVALRPAGQARSA